jgi:hypothetical protein
VNSASEIKISEEAVLNLTDYMSNCSFWALQVIGNAKGQRAVFYQFRI